MKKIILALFLFFSLQLFGQDNISKAYYGKKLLEQNIEDADADLQVALSTVEKILKTNMKDVEYELIFTSNESVFKPVDKIGLSSDTNYELALMWGGGNGIIYINFDTKEKIEQKNAYGKLFLINKPFNTWKLFNQEKKIGNYTCLKATTQKTINTQEDKKTVVITAWYAPEIASKQGPCGYEGLPGLIIELSTNEVIFFLKKIVLNPEKNVQIKKPTKGKEITQNEFEEISKKTADDFFFGN